MAWEGLWGTFKELQQAWINLQFDLELGFEFNFRLQIRGIEIHLGELRIEDEKLREIMQSAVDRVNNEIGNIENAANSVLQAGTAVNVILGGQVDLPGTDILINPLQAHTILRNGIPMIPGSYTINNPASKIESGLFTIGDTIQASSYFPENSYELPGPNKAAVPIEAYEQLSLFDNFLITKHYTDSNKEKGWVDYDVDIDSNIRKVTAHNVEVGELLSVDYIPAVGPSGLPEICEGIFRVSEGPSGPEEFVVNSAPDFTFEVANDPKILENAPKDPFFEVSAEPDTRTPKDWIVNYATYDGAGRLYFDGRPQSEGGDVTPGSDLDIWYDGHNQMNVKRERLVGGTRRSRDGAAWAKAQIEQQIQDLKGRNRIFEDIKNA